MNKIIEITNYQGLQPIWKWKYGIIK